MKQRLLIAALVLLGAALQAADAGKRYLKLKDDGDLFVGEGVAETKEFDGDGLKALEAARERARGALASSIQVRITSETTEVLKNGKDGSSEELQSKSKSLSDLVLENIHNEDFADFPDKGKVTVLAYVSKEDYRRQVAGKGPRFYRPEYGLKLAVWGWSLPGIEKIEDSGTVNGAPTDAPVSSGSGGNSGNGSSIAPGYGLEFVWQDFSLGFDFYRKDLALYIYDPKRKVYDAKSDGIEVDSLSLGWQYIPWNWRVQPFVPLDLHIAHVALFNANGMATAASAGLGIRYWPSDAFSFEITARYFQGISSASMPDVLIRKDQPAELSLTGPQGRVAIQWSSF